MKCYPAVQVLTIQRQKVRFAAWQEARRSPSMKMKTQQKFLSAAFGLETLVRVNAFTVQPESGGA
ncbi:hypothetical protein A7J57_07005 [Agrobacterium tumefaciens]|uniref:Uncharacterized protein n=1 Tax=Agrobacterium tumefaciens TaxID=358 RepID=A0A176WU03_AGRTU|nr:hypothetical protein A7J57_07005 [Agrobacterium tumefaciens]